MAAAASTTTIYPGSHPFAESDTADVILRAIDGAEFRVHRVILSQASSVFAGMFEIPQPPQDAHSPDPPSLPIVDLTESRGTLEKLLMLCYPMTTPLLQLSDINAVVSAARKYDMQWVLPRVGAILTRAKTLRDPANALRVFAIACDLDLLAEAEEAARASLREPLGKDLHPSLGGISARGLFKLLDYRRRVREAIVRCLMDLHLCEPSALDISPREWDFPDTQEYWHALVLPAEYCIQGHGQSAAHKHYVPFHYTNDLGDQEHDVLPRHIRLDEPYIIEALIEQTEDIHKAFALQIPSELIRGAIRMTAPCELCGSEAMAYLRDFFTDIQERLLHAMHEVSLDSETVP
ncbi:hypothetical protein C8Q77DRAFT_1160623 [Trametes polyzona]|nr:hypothetical protein C8Q77DRAFT_1160623 [Trametes polyzona]